MVLPHPSRYLLTVAKTVPTINAVHLTDDGNRQFLEAPAKAQIKKPMRISPEMEPLRQSVRICAGQEFPLGRIINARVTETTFEADV